MKTVILCGGIGSRLWPISRELLPKQFLPLFEGESLFQKTIRRNISLSSSLLIVTNDKHYFMAYSQLKDVIDDEYVEFLLETEQKNTAVAMALAAMSVKSNEILLVVPSDHLIADTKAYEDAIKQAYERASCDECIVLFGIKPTYPETGFGYIHASDECIQSFVEKPPFEIADAFCKRHDYFWNSGMFCFKAGYFLQELECHAPMIFHAARESFEKRSLQQAPRRSLFPAPHCDAQSVDNALMQKAENLKLIPADIGWSDMGSFEALDLVLSKDSHHNAATNIASNASTDNVPIFLDSSHNLLVTENRQIALIDVDSLMIVDTADAILIAKKGSGQKVKKILEILSQRNNTLHSTHVKVYRPWGNFIVLEEGDGYKIKKIEVLPGCRLSLQKHFHRSEHWIVVSGTASVQIADKEITLCANESTYIPIGEKHRLSNPGKIPIVLIEVQNGSYLGEDDIVRFDDDYGRKEE